MFASGWTVTTEDISGWTSDQVQQYLDKYNIRYKHNDPSLLDTVKYYRDAAIANTEIFGEKINHVIDGLRIKLAKQKGLSREDADAILSDIQHYLRRLELQGQLSGDRVAQALERVRRDATKKKIVTEAQWRDIYNDVTGSFQTQSWYQKVLHRRPVDTQASASLNKWLQGVANRLHESKQFSREQANAIAEQIQESFKSTKDIKNLGNKHWRQKFKHDLEKQGQLTQDQIRDALRAVEREVNAYKVFAMDYAGDTYEQTQKWVGEMSDNIKDKGHAALDYAYEWLYYLRDCALNTWPLSKYYAPLAYHQPKNPWSPQENYASLKSAASSISQDLYSSVSSAKSAGVRSASEMANSWRDSFAHYWRDKEFDAYRRLGYTEAQIDWIQSYLATKFKDQKSFVKHNIDEAINTINRYLEDTKVQSREQVEHQVDQLKSLLDAWKEKAKSYTS